MSQKSARIRAALDIHAPCHTADTEDYGCRIGHYGEIGWPAKDEPAVCMSCTYDDRTVTYPCPTATALGVATNEGNSK